MIGTQVLPDGLVCLNPYVWVHLSGIGPGEITLQHFLGHGVLLHPPPHQAASPVSSSVGREGPTNPSSIERRVP